MATRAIVPRADGEGSLGTEAKKWGGVYADAVTATTVTPTNLNFAENGFLNGDVTTGGLTITTRLGNRIPTEAINISPSGVKFTGTFNGTATKAMQDGEGNVIADTYAKKSDVGGSVDLTPYLTKADAETTYAKKTDIPDTTDMLTKTVADATYAKKGEAGGDTSGCMKLDEDNVVSGNWGITDDKGNIVIYMGAIKVSDESVPLFQGCATYAGMDNKGNSFEATYVKKTDAEASVDFSQAGEKFTITTDASSMNVTISAPVDMHKYKYIRLFAKTDSNPVDMVLINAKSLMYTKDNLSTIALGEQLIQVGSVNGNMLLLLPVNAGYKDLVFGIAGLMTNPSLTILSAEGFK